MAPNSDRLFLPAKNWPARIAYQSAVRAGAERKISDLRYEAVVERDEEWKNGCSHRHEQQSDHRGNYCWPSPRRSRGAAGILERDRGLFPTLRAVRAALGAQ